MARKVTLTKVDPYSLGNIQAAVFAALGILIGLTFGISLLFNNLAEGETANGLVFAIASIAIHPLVYGVLGFLAGYVGALIYNLAAKTAGGIKIALQFEDEQI